MERSPVAQKAEFGQVWTPRWVVDRILDEVGYTVDNPRLLTATILEPSFGAGAFFYGILDRLLAAAKQAGLDAAATRTMIETNVWGIEYDPEVFASTITALDAYLLPHGITGVRWAFTNQDALTFAKPAFFDYVVGNPPYIRVHDMDAQLRASIKAFNHATGTTDLYVIFFELGLQLLKTTGVLGYITPNSFMRNTSQHAFRRMLVNQHLLEALIDFGPRPIFADAATYTVITVLSRRHPTSPTFRYHGETGKQPPYLAPVTYADLAAHPGNPWVFTDTTDGLFLNAIAERAHALNDLLTVQYGVATLRDKIYTSPPADVEAVVTRPVVKASTYKGEPITRRILFPYTAEQGQPPQVIPEPDLAAAYPHAYDFLRANEGELLRRDRDRGSAWYAYGRSQGLNNIGRPKLVLSHVVADNQTSITAYLLPADVVVYSGMFITATPSGLSLVEIKTILESEDFCRFVKLNGKDMAGGYKSFTPKTLKAYRVV